MQWKVRGELKREKVALVCRVAQMVRLKRSALAFLSWRRISARPNYPRSPQCNTRNDRNRRAKARIFSPSSTGPDRSTRIFSARFWQSIVRESAIYLAPFQSSCAMFGGQFLAFTEQVLFQHRWSTNFPRKLMEIPNDSPLKKIIVEPLCSLLNLNFLLLIYLPTI